MDAPSAPAPQSIVDEILANPTSDRLSEEVRRLAERSPSAAAILLEQVAEELSDDDPTRASRWLTEAAALWSDGAGDAKRAARALRAALDVCPTDEDALAQLTRLYRENGKHRALARLLEVRAEAFLGQAAADPAASRRAAEAFTVLGHLLRDPPLESPTEAIAAYNRAIETGAATHETFRAARDLYLEAEQSADALPLFALEREATDDPSDLVSLYREEAAARKLAGDGAGATALLKLAQKLEPESVSLVEELWQSIAERIEAGDTVMPGERAEAAAALAAVAQKLEKTALPVQDLPTLKLAFGLSVRALGGVERATELVRQAEVLVGLGAERPLALRHVEPGLAPLDAREAAPLVVRLQALAGMEQVLDLHERAVARTSAADRVRAIEVAALTAVQAPSDRLARFFAAVLPHAMHEPALSALEKVARDADAARRGTAVRSIFAGVLAQAEPQVSDGGRLRAALLRRAARIARKDLGDADQAFEWIGDALFARLEGALEPLESRLEPLRTPTPPPSSTGRPASQPPAIPAPPRVPTATAPAATPSSSPPRARLPPPARPLPQPVVRPLPKQEPARPPARTRPEPAVPAKPEPPVAAKGEPNAEPPIAKPPAPKPAAPLAVDPPRAPMIPRPASVAPVAPAAAAAPTATATESPAPAAVEPPRPPPAPTPEPPRARRAPLEPEIAEAAPPPAAPLEASGETPAPSAVAPSPPPPPVAAPATATPAPVSRRPALFVPPTPPVPRRPGSIAPPAPARPGSEPPPGTPAPPPVVPATPAPPIVAQATPRPVPPPEPSDPGTPIDIDTEGMPVGIETLTNLQAVVIPKLPPKRAETLVVEVEDEPITAPKPAPPPPPPPAASAVPRARPSSASSRRRVSRAPSADRKDPFTSPSDDPADRESWSPSEPAPEDPSATLPTAPLVERAPPMPARSLAIPSPSVSAPAPPRRRRVSGDELIADLFQAMHELDFCADSVEAASFTLALAMEKLGSDAGIVHLYDIDAREFVVVRAAGPALAALRGLRTPDDDLLAAEALRTRATVMVRDPAADPRASAPRWNAIRSLLGTPLRAIACARAAQAGRFLGLIELCSTSEAGGFEAGDEHALFYIAERFTEFVASHGVTLGDD